MDLYGILGIAREATYQQIRDGYRKMSKKHHPDAGGDPARFNEIQVAHDILTDEDRRARYDRTGDVSEKVPEGNADASLYNFIMQLMNNALNSTHDLARQDLKNTMAQMLGHERVNMQNGVKNGEQIKKRLETAQKRMKFKGKGENLLAKLLQGQIDTNEGLLVKCRENLAMMDRAEKFMDEYDYETDMPPTSAAPVKEEFYPWYRATGA